MATKKQSDQPVTEKVYQEAPGEFPIIGYEPLEVPQGFTIADLLARLEALEASVGKPAAKK